MKESTFIDDEIERIVALSQKRELDDAERRADAGDAANDEALKLRKDNTVLRDALSAAVPDVDERIALLSGLTNG